jgi:hypothetical protein
MSDKATKALFKLHQERYPEAQPRDFYKLIYQGVFGVGHIISIKAKDYLLEEAKRVALSDYPVRPLLEPVSPEGLMVRVYLRQFMRMGLDLDRLFTVMRRSAELEGSEDVFLKRWRVLRDMVESGKLGLDHDGLDEIQKTIETSGLIPMHHTEPYREAYYPAYRVVWKPFLDEEFGFL